MITEQQLVILLLLAIALVCLMARLAAWAVRDAYERDMPHDGVIYRIDGDSYCVECDTVWAMIKLECHRAQMEAMDRALEGQSEDDIIHMPDIPTQEN